MKCWFAWEVNIGVTFALTTLVFSLMPPTTQWVLRLHLAQAGIHCPRSMERMHRSEPTWAPTAWQVRPPLTLHVVREATPTWGSTIPPPRPAHTTNWLWVGSWKTGLRTAQFPWHRACGLPLPTQVHMRPSSQMFPTPLTRTVADQPHKFLPEPFPWVTTFHNHHENKALAMFGVGVKIHPTHGIYKESSQRPLSNLKNKLSFKAVIKANDPSWTLSFCSR